jgi:hypothetical protein
MKNIVLLLLLFLATTSMQMIDQEVKISQRTINIDYSLEQDSITGEFVIINLTDRDIKILGTDKACTCSSVILSKTNLPSKDSLLITMKTATKNESFIDTHFVIVLDTQQKYYKFRLKGKRK